VCAQLFAAAQEKRTAAQQSAHAETAIGTQPFAQSGAPDGSGSSRMPTAMFDGTAGTEFDLTHRHEQHPSAKPAAGASKSWTAKSAKAAAKSAKAEAAKAHNQSSEGIAQRAIWEAAKAAAKAAAAKAAAAKAEAEAAEARANEAAAAAIAAAAVVVGPPGSAPAPSSMGTLVDHGASAWPNHGDELLASAEATHSAPPGTGNGNGAGRSSGSAANRQARKPAARTVGPRAQGGMNRCRRCHDVTDLELQQGPCRMRLKLPDGVVMPRCAHAADALAVPCAP
jgi:hypothetical protein